MNKNKNLNKRLLAFYLPQFHPIPENDKWWGRGFTEWTNVTKATPKFKGHYQPHLPADLGFYDLRLPEIMDAQAAMAQAYGIYGFCYYHYWFNGKKLLEFPIEQMVKRGKPNFPFCLCWANENWTRKWDGLEKEVLIAQNYNKKDHLAHIKYLFSFFKDKRYIKINNKPVFVVYRPELIPNLGQTTDLWRETALKEGFSGLYLIGIERYSQFKNLERCGLDALMEFQPNGKHYPNTQFSRLLSKTLHKLGMIKSHFANNIVIPYEKIVDTLVNMPLDKRKIFPCIIPMWDNTARRKKGAFTLSNPSPYQYR